MKCSSWKQLLKLTLKIEFQFVFIVRYATRIFNKLVWLNKSIEELKLFLVNRNNASDCCIFIKCTITTKLKESFFVLLVFHFNSKWKTKFKLKKMYWSIKQPTKNILFSVCVINSVLTPFFNQIWHIKYSSRQMFVSSSHNLFNSIVFSSNWTSRWITHLATPRGVL